jgi:acetoin utilization protein AcuB
MRVTELMSRNVSTIEADRTCYDAITRMSRAKVRHLPVLDRDGTLVGIVTDRDIRQRLFAPDFYGRLGQVPVATLLGEAVVRDVMSAPVLSIDPASDIVLAAARMRAAKIGSLVVAEGNKLLGIITELDMLRHLIQAEANRDPEVDIVISYP